MAFLSVAGLGKDRRTFAVFPPAISILALTCDYDDEDDDDDGDEEDDDDDDDDDEDDEDDDDDKDGKERT
jgi:hypothetical protein